MPFGHIIVQTDTQTRELSERLRREWSHPQDAPDSPVIIETTDKLRPQQTPTHLYVIWDAWRDLAQRERSEMMMEVYEDVRGRPFALNVTVAMGLTPQEAERLNIRYEVEPAPAAV